jgi:hypothetical protein
VPREARDCRAYRGPRDAVPVVSPVALRSPDFRFVLSDDRLRHARCGQPHSRAAFRGRVLRLTGLPSRSALVAPPLRLAALRWRVAFAVLVRSRPPPGVSTAFLVAVTHCSESPNPRIATLENVPAEARSGRGTFSRSGTSHRCATSRASRGPSLPCGGSVCTCGPGIGGTSRGDPTIS